MKQPILGNKKIEKDDEGCMDPREFKISFMLSLVLGYFCVEMFVGYRFNSLALVADACHMLSDGLCLVVALGSFQLRPFVSFKAQCGFIAEPILKWAYLEMSLSWNPSKSL